MTQHHAEQRQRTQADAVRGSLWTLLASTLNLPLSLIVAAVAVRALGTDGFAELSLFAAVYLYALPLFNGGISESAMQWIAEAHARGRDDDVVGIVRRVTGYHLLVQGPLTIALTVFLLRSSPLAVTLGLVACNIAYVVVESSSVVLMGTARNGKVARFSLIMNLVSAPAVVTVAIVTGSGAVTWAAQTACLSIAPVLGFVSLEPTLRRAMLRPRWPSAWPVGFKRYAFSALVSGYVAMLVFGRSELFVLSAFHETAAVAAFAVVAALASKLTVLANSVLSPIAPVAAGLVAASPDLAPQALGRALRISSLLAGGTMALVVPMATALLPVLFGREYDHAQPAVLALGSVGCLLTAAAPLQAFAFATRSVRQVLRVNVVCLVVDVTVALALIGPFGLGGAVVASCAAQSLSAALLIRVMSHRLDLPIQSVLRHFACLVACLPAAAVAAWTSLVVHPVPVALAASMIAGAVITLVAMWIFPGARLLPEDVDMVARGMPARWSGPSARIVTSLRLVRDAR